jgi:hypothetical protein
MPEPEFVSRSLTEDDLATGSLKADGSVPMTGDLNVDGNTLAEVGGLTRTDNTPIGNIGGFRFNDSWGLLEVQNGLRVAPTGGGTPIMEVSVDGIGLNGGTPGQGAAIANATDGPSAIARLNDLLAFLRARGDIAT